MDLRSLRYFVRIAELGSITRAAAHLHIAQPALTRHVQQLEDELNVALFTRLAEEEMVLVPPPGPRPLGAVPGDELRRTPLILGDGLRAALDALLAGRDMELQVETELNDLETIRLMVAEGAGTAVLPLAS